MRSRILGGRLGFDGRLPVRIASLSGETARMTQIKTRTSASEPMAS